MYSILMMVVMEDRMALSSHTMHTPSGKALELKYGALKFCFVVRIFILTLTRYAEIRFPRWGMINTFDRGKGKLYSHFFFFF